MTASVITRNKPITRGQLHDLQAAFQRQADLAQARRECGNPHGEEGLRDYAEQCYWTGRVHLLSDFITQMGDVR